MPLLMGYEVRVGVCVVVQSSDGHEETFTVRCAGKASSAPAGRSSTPTIPQAVREAIITAMGRAGNHAEAVMRNEEGRLK